MPKSLRAHYNLPQAAGIERPAKAGECQALAGPDVPSGAIVASHGPAVGWRDSEREICRNQLCEDIMLFVLGCPMEVPENGLFVSPES